MLKETHGRVVIVMGVSGSGKSTVGARLADVMGGVFFDADDFHPRANIEKMAKGVPLNDADRIPWLRKLREEIVDGGEGDEVRVLACSGLKRCYREVLSCLGVVWVYLHGSRELLAARLGAREGHFMKVEMLDSQLADLEVPAQGDVIAVDISESPDAIVEEVRSQLLALE